ncbi:putative NRPS-like enzyme [Xylariales sp. PMI_506]|nr:putative NRPS-like enzyme [Xylariales sp. PMI_506]
MSEMNQIRTFDQLLRQRANDEDQTPLLAFTSTRQGVADYDPITGATLNRFVDGAARCLSQRGFPAVEEEVIVGVSAPTDLDYLVNIFALMRLGYTPFQLSQRLAPSAVKALLVSTQPSRQVLLYTPDHTSFKAGDLNGIELYSFVKRGEYDSLQHSEPLGVLAQRLDTDRDDRRRCLMMHSSGSTGLPKPIDFNHKKLMLVATYAQDGKAFITLPFSHALGMMTFMQAIHKRRTMHAISGYVPQTHDTVTAAIKAAQPDIVWTVPYVLKLLAEKPDGIDAIKNCRFVSCGGSRLDDGLGDMLTDAGVHIAVQYGSTETGHMMSSVYRNPEDKAWNYLRPAPHVAPYILFQPVDGERYECVILDGHKGKTISNSDDPPNSWHTNDLFVPHPSIPNAWKFVTRMDDRITLINGEKVLPLNIESRVRCHPLVREAVVFGIDREVPGLLLFRAPSTGHIDDQNFVDQVWPAVKDANKHAEAFSQITRDMIIVISEDIECPSTEKSSIKRQLVFREFASEINAAYTAMEAVNRTKSLSLTISELEEWIVDTMRSQGYDIKDTRTDFFSVGVDSLQAIHIRALILRNIDLGGCESECTSMIVFDCGNTERLAKRLYAIRTSNRIDKEQDVEIASMQTLIDKYSDFSKHGLRSKSSPSGSSHMRQVIILTGATGFLGAHVLAALVASRHVEKVYAFVRPESGASQLPSARLKIALQSKGFCIPLDKVVPVAYDLTLAELGLEDSSLYEILKFEATHIIHCAWPVNFAIPLASFETQLLGLHNLLGFCLQTTQNARLLFCSSVGVAQSTKGPAILASAPIPSLEDCGRTGYARSKLVGERIVEEASRCGVDAMILRIGQIIPGRRRGTKLWNPAEAAPLMIRSGRKDSTGALPILDAGRDSCSWLEADTLADTILELANIGLLNNGAALAAQLVYNLVNPNAFSWKDELLPALQKAGLDFDTVSWQEWLERLESSIEDASTNPSKKLLGYWRKQADRSAGEITFDTSAVESASTALKSGLRAVDDGFMTQIVAAWKLI